METREANKGNTKKMRLKGAFFVLSLLFLFIVFWLGYQYGQSGTLLGVAPSGVTNSDKGKPSDVDFSLFWEAWNKLRQKSVSPPDNQKMMYGAISGMLGATNDPYTVFFTPEDNKRFKEDIQGEFDGIGVEIVIKNNYPTVVAPLSNSPAEKAGLRAGDIIVEVDGVKTDTIGFNETIDRIRGVKGTQVALKVIREGKEEPIPLSITREKIVVKSVEWESKTENGKKIAIVKVRQFGDDTSNLFEEFADQAAKSKPDGIIVDLRNDPGGYLETSIDLASYFLDGGVVVSEKDRSGDTKEYKTTRKAKLQKIPLVVLVNQGSASASEIFAGAIQDRGVGKIVGEKTFGKGSVQELSELSDDSAVKITVAAWLTPKGRVINGEGITPDVVVESPENSKDDVQLNKAIELLK
ncbi:MAG TPA: S41 family peptidase [bacterium]|nr:S41 family peptidase [bacterium]